MQKNIGRRRGFSLDRCYIIPEKLGQKHAGFGKACKKAWAPPLFRHSLPSATPPRRSRTEAWPGRQSASPTKRRLQRRDRLQHSVERRSRFIGERGAFEAIEPDGAVLARGKGGDGGHHAVEFRQAACVSV